MKFKAVVTVSKDQMKYMERNMVAASPVLTCQVCNWHSGSSDSMGRARTVSSWYWTTQNWDRRQFTVESYDSDCREITFSRLVDFAQYVESVQTLSLHDLDIGYRNKNQDLAQIQIDLSNGFWLGLTDSTQRWTALNHASASVPLELLDMGLGCGGPLFSICSWFIKLGVSCLADPYGRYEEYTVDHLMEHAATLRALLASEDPLTPALRMDILRETVRFLWVGLDGATHSSHEYHKWSKYAVLWQALGGLNFLRPDNGFSYYVLGSDRKLYEPGMLQCNHNASHLSRGSVYNGSLTFANQYHKFEVDGRAITRFLNGGCGLLKKTAISHLAMKPWSTKST